jgi:hypothetical protein
VGGIFALPTIAIVACFCRVVPSGALFWFCDVAERKRLLYEKFFSPREQRKVEVSFALTQAA